MAAVHQGRTLRESDTVARRTPSCNYCSATHPVRATTHPGVLSESDNKRMASMLWREAIRLCQKPSISLVVSNVCR